MNYFAIALLSLFIYLLVYVLINRICECFEKCAQYKSQSRYWCKCDDNKK